MFKDFVKAIQKNLQQMSKDSSRLFTVNVDTEELYNLYLDSFPAGTNEIYRETREYDCSCCRHFIRDVGNVVSIKNGELHTIWGINPVSDDKYNVVAAALDAYMVLLLMMKLQEYEMADLEVQQRMNRRVLCGSEVKIKKII